MDTVDVDVERERERDELAPEQGEERERNDLKGVRIV